MRINRYIAWSTGLSRRMADKAIADGRVMVNRRAAEPGMLVTNGDTVTLDNKVLTPPEVLTSLLLHKPVGYVVSRNGQGSKTIYDLLPSKFHNLKPVGRLDKDSSGLLLLTNDGKMANQLTHPSYQKEKVYEIVLDKPLQPQDKELIMQGVLLDDGLSTMRIFQISDFKFRISIKEGRNRQIRRTFASLGYTVTKLHRTQFGEYSIEELTEGKYLLISNNYSNIY